MRGATRTSPSTPLRRSRFNPRPSCVGRRRASQAASWTACFNPRPSCEGRPLVVVVGVYLTVVSTHAPHARGDNHVLDVGQVVPFQPTPLMRGATVLLPSDSSTMGFQPTPLMRGATRGSRPAPPPPRCFNPRPSCKGRRDGSMRCNATHKFQPTPLMRGATLHLVYVADADVVSTHAPHARGDSFRRAEKPVGLFQPTPLMRGATRPTGRCTGAGCFNPRPSCEGRHEPRHRLR